MEPAPAQERRSLRYIRLAAFLADQPEDLGCLVMTISEIEKVVGEALPPSARFPSWWRNDERKMHSRAWLTAGWEVAEMGGGEPNVTFIRRNGS